ncbi:hypothetical protein Tco_1278214, partial [Tanacetum coccineum]
RWSSSVDHDVEDLPPIPPHLKRHLFNRLDGLTIYERPMLKGSLVQAELNQCWELGMAPVLYRNGKGKLLSSYIEGVVEVFEPASPPVSLVIGAPPPPHMPEGDVLQGNHEMEDAKNKVPLTEHLTIKRNRSTDEVGGSGSVVAGEQLDPSYTLLVPFNVTPPMTMYLILDDDDEVEKTASVEVDVCRTVEGGEYGLFNFFEIYKTSSLKEPEWCNHLLNNTTNK